MIVGAALNKNRAVFFALIGGVDGRKKFISLSRKGV